MKTKHTKDIHLKEQIHDCIIKKEVNLRSGADILGVYTNIFADRLIILGFLCSVGGTDKDLYFEMFGLQAGVLDIENLLLSSLLSLIFQFVLIQVIQQYFTFDFLQSCQETVLQYTEAIIQITFDFNGAYTNVFCNIWTNIFCNVFCKWGQAVDIEAREAGEENGQAVFRNDAELEEGLICVLHYTAMEDTYHFVIVILVELVADMLDVALQGLFDIVFIAPLLGLGVPANIVYPEVDVAVPVQFK